MGPAERPKTRTAARDGARLLIAFTDDMQTLEVRAYAGHLPGP